MGGVGSIILSALVYQGRLPYSPQPAEDARHSIAYWGLIFAVATFVFYFRALSIPFKEIPKTSKDLQDGYAAAILTAAQVGEDAEDTANRSNWWAGQRGLRSPIFHQVSAIGPERSKYCSASRAILSEYDHYCVFLRRPVARENYGAFLGTIILAAATCVCVTLLALSLFMVDETPTVTCALLGVYYAFSSCCFFILVSFHLYLNLVGLTGWEMIQLGRTPPVYLFDSTGSFSNPYNKGFVKNLCARICPGTCAQEPKHDDIP